MRQKQQQQSISRSRQLTFPGTLVRKDNSLIRATIQLGNLLSNRILATLIASIQFDADHFEPVYQLPVSSLNLDKSGREYKYIREACSALLSCKIFLEWQNPRNPEQPDWEGMTFFNKVTYKDGIISASFYEGIAPFLLALKKNFTQYNLLEYSVLHSVYTQRLFEILSSYRRLSDVTLNLEQLKTQLNVSPSLRKNFKDFRARILEKSYQDINSLTSLHFEYEVIKTGRKITDIKFIFQTSTPKQTIPHAAPHIVHQLIDGVRATQNVGGGVPTQLAQPKVVTETALQTLDEIGKAIFEKYKGQCDLSDINLISMYFNEFKDKGITVKLESLPVKIVDAKNYLSKIYQKYTREARSRLQSPRTEFDRVTDHATSLVGSQLREISTSKEVPDVAPITQSEPTQPVHGKIRLRSKIFQKFQLQKPKLKATGKGVTDHATSLVGSQLREFSTPKEVPDVAPITQSEPTQPVHGKILLRSKIFQKFQLQKPELKATGKGVTDHATSLVGSQLREISTPKVAPDKTQNQEDHATGATTPINRTEDSIAKYQAVLEKLRNARNKRA